MVVPLIRIAVLGGGVMGLTSAARMVGVLEKITGVADGEVGVTDGEVGVTDGEVGVTDGEVGVFPSATRNSVSVDLISENFSPNTTGDLAAGLCYAIGVNDTSDDLVMKWLGDTTKHYQSIYESPLAGEAGISLLPGYRFINERSAFVRPPKRVLDSLVDWQLVDASEYPCKGTKFSGAIRYTSMLAECGKYLPWIRKSFLEGKVNIINMKVESFSELYDRYDIIVNCTGLASTRLAGDEVMTPGRGHLIKVHAPWLKHGYHDGLTYVIPGIDMVFVGGTYQLGDWSTDVRKEDEEDVWIRACDLVPSLKGAKKIRSAVGLRPSRPSVRLESETIEISPEKKVTLIHNYGHGGAGVSLSWGCAGDVAELVKQAIEQRI